MIWAILLVILLLLALAAAEWWLRSRYGLGDPVIYVADPELEYLLRPGVHRRRGSHVEINRWHMRTGELGPHKTGPGELRILVLGDSVVFGGEQVDQYHLATHLLQERLSQRLGVPVTVANASATSWGPPNLLAYLKRFGTFEADVVVVVLSSHDWCDVPLPYKNLGSPERPERKPMGALHELAQHLTARSRRKLRRLLRGKQRAVPAAVAGSPYLSRANPPQADVDWALSATGELLKLARAGGARTLVALHREPPELAEPYPGHFELKRIAEANADEVIDLGPAFAAELERGGRPYRDLIHPTTQGQRIMAQALEEPIVRLLSGRG